MNAITPAIPDRAVVLVGAVGDRLRGVIGILESMRARSQDDDAYVLQVIEDALADQIDTLENHLVPQIAGRMATYSTTRG